VRATQFSMMLVKPRSSPPTCKFKPTPDLRDPDLHKVRIGHPGILAIFVPSRAGTGGHEGSRAAS
jgi:hypothetical protein